MIWIGGWKLFYLGANQSMSAEAGLGILTNPQLSDCVFDWIPLGSQASMLQLKVKNRLLCLLQEYALAFNENGRYLSLFCFTLATGSEV